MNARSFPPDPTLALSISVLATVAATHALLQWLHPALAYAWGWIGSSMLYAGTAFMLLRNGLEGRRLKGVLILAILVRLSFLALDPIGSDDIYRYVWDGKVQDAGISPYVFAPNDPELARLASLDLPARVNNPEVKSAYFPFSQWIFLGVYRVFGDSLIGIRLVTSAAELLTLAGMWILLGALGARQSNVLLYALCPLPIFQFSLDGHVDSIGIVLLVAGLYLWKKDRHVWALFLFSLSMSVKPVALVLLPLLFLAEDRWKARMLVVIVPAVVVSAQFIPYMSSWASLDGLAAFAQHWTFNGALFSFVEYMLNDNQRSRLICAMVLGGILLMLYAGRNGLAERAGFAVSMLLLCSPVVHPWYVAWLLPVLPLAPRTSSVLFVSLVSLTAFTIVTYQMDGVWIDYTAVRWLEYLPVVGAFIYEAGRNGGTQTIRKLIRR